MLTFSQKRFFVSLDELALFVEPAITLEIGIKNQIFREKPEVGILIPIHLFDSCNDGFFCRYETQTAQQSGSQL